MDDKHDLQRRINEKANAHTPANAWDSTVAIVIPHDSVVYQLGSGILFRVDDHSFVVTAAHVIKEANKQGKTLGISSEPPSLVAVPGDWICSSEGQYGTAEDPFDISIHKLPQSTVKRLGRKTFLTFDDIEFGSQSATAVYTLFGFPGLWPEPSTTNSAKLQLKPFQYTSFAYDRDTNPFKAYQERFHLLIDAQLQYSSKDDGSPAKFQDVQGNDAPFPDGLSGISGCSVWRIGDLSVPIDEWSQERSRIVAVVTDGYPREQAIMATRWIAPSTLLHSAFPEVHKAMDAWLSS